MGKKKILPETFFNYMWMKNYIARTRYILLNVKICLFRFVNKFGDFFLFSCDRKEQNIKIISFRLYVDEKIS